MVHFAPTFQGRRHGYLSLKGTAECEPHILKDGFLCNPFLWRCPLVQGL